MAAEATVLVMAPAAVANKSRFAFLLTAKDAVLTRASSGLSALGRLANKAHLGGALRWVSNTFGWAASKISTVFDKIGKAGILGITTAILATKTGQKIAGAVVRAVARPIGWLASKLYNGFTGLLRMFGGPGKRVANRIDKAVFGAMDWVARTTKPAIDRVAQIFNPDNTAMRFVATVGKVVSAVALSTAFLPGAWVYAGYAVAAPIIFESLRPTRIKKAIDKAATEAKAEQRKARAKTSKKTPLRTRVAANAQTAAERVELDKIEAATKRLEQGEPVLSRNMVKAQRKAAAQAAAAENDAKQKAAAAARREAAAANKAAKAAAADVANGVIDGVVVATA